MSGLQKFVFLDFDGVICTDETYTDVRRRYGTWHGHEAELIEPTLVKNVDLFCQAWGASVVISSSWRIHHTLDELTDMLREKGLTVPVVGTTPTMLKMSMHYDRADLIRAWLELVKDPEWNNNCMFVVLDDDETCKAWGAHWVQTYFHSGFTVQHLHKLLERIGPDRLPYDLVYKFDIGTTAEEEGDRE